MSQPIVTVARPFLPPFDDFVEILRGVWDRCQLTNDGPLLRELEQRLADYLGVRHAVVVNNGTIALQLVYRALELKGAVVTTPFSYVATTSTLVWEGIEPVFADVEPDTLTLDARRAEAALTPETSAIVATHVYGNPCDVEGLADVARRRGVRLVYDAAHAFGAGYCGRSLAAFGDAATLSFHATKLFHTGEGGAVVTENDEVARRIRWLRSFGHETQETFCGVGINGKTSELHAALGLAVLPHVRGLIQLRLALCARYDELLFAPGSPLGRPARRPGTMANGAYYPVLLPSEEVLFQVRAALHAAGFIPRRYFYPALNRLPYVEPVPMPVAEDAARRVLCLPLHHELTTDTVTAIARELRAALAW